MARHPVMRLAITGLALAALLLTVPAAVGHVTHESDDGAYFITIGQQGEPVYTFQPTNLDLIIRENVDGERGDEVDGVHETLTAVLIAPGGEELAGELQKQRNTVGRYQFDGGYTLTQPGVYTLRLEGMIGETPVSGVYDMPHAIHAQSEIMFPDQDLPDLRDLAALQARVDALEAQLAALEQGDGGTFTPTNSAPVPGLLVLGALGTLTLVAGRRRR